MFNAQSSENNVTAHVCDVIGRTLQTFWRNQKSYPSIFLVGHVRGKKTFKIVILRAGISTLDFPNAKGECYPICRDVHLKLRMSGVLTSLPCMFPWYGVLAQGPFIFWTPLHLARPTTLLLYSFGCQYACPITRIVKGFVMKLDVDTFHWSLFTLKEMVVKFGQNNRHYTYGFIYLLYTWSVTP